MNSNHPYQDGGNNGHGVYSMLTKSKQKRNRKKRRVKYGIRRNIYKKHKAIAKFINYMLPGPRQNPESVVKKCYHIAVDFSNILKGGHKVIPILRDDFCRVVPETGLEVIDDIRRNVETDPFRLMQFLEDSYSMQGDIGHCLIAGSMKLESIDPSIFSSLGWNAYIESGSSEVVVDDTIHSFCINFIERLHFDRHIQHTLVLVTGDGNPNFKSDRMTTSFPIVVKYAVMYGFKVDVWGWRNNMSQKFHMLRKEFPRCITIRYFDEVPFHVIERL